VNFISLPQEVRGIFVIKAAVEMQNNLLGLHSRNGQSVINCFTKIWQDVVSLIDCMDKSKKTPNSLD
jgi:hypothetical protein